MKCKSCGKEIQPDFKMCPYCGAQVEAEEPETAFVRLPMEADEKPEEDEFEESRKERKARLKREAEIRKQEEQQDETEDYEDEDEDEEEQEYYEIPLKRILVIAAAVVIIAGLGIGGYFMFFANPLTAATQTIEAGTTVDPLELVSLKSNASDKYTYTVSENNIDTSKTGEYTVIYELENTSNGKTSLKTFTFQVVDTTAPIISIADSITVPIGSTFNIADYATVTDNVDGVMDASGISVDGTVNTSTAGTYPITLTISDAAGNKASVSVNAVVEDMGDPGTFMGKLSGTWYNEDSGLVIAFSVSGSTYTLDIGYYQSEGFGTGVLNFTSVNNALTAGSANWEYTSYYIDDNGSTVYEDPVATNVTIDTGEAGDDMITVDLGFGDGDQDFTYLYN